MFEMQYRQSFRFRSLTCAFIFYYLLFNIFSNYGIKLRIINTYIYPKWLKINPTSNN